MAGKTCRKLQGVGTWLKIKLDLPCKCLLCQKPNRSGQCLMDACDGKTVRVRGQVICSHCFEKLHKLATERAIRNEINEGIFGKGEEYKAVKDRAMMVRTMKVFFEILSEYEVDLLRKHRFMPSGLPISWEDIEYYKKMMEEKQEKAGRLSEAETLRVGID